LQIPYSEFEFYRPDLRRRLELSKKAGQDGILSIHILSGQGQTGVLKEATQYRENIIYV
jgi:hypothetical protein